MVRDGNVLTNDERDHVLMGITRDSVITLARDLGYMVYVGDAAGRVGGCASSFLHAPLPRLRRSRRSIAAPSQRQAGPITLNCNAYFAATSGRDAKTRLAAPVTAKAEVK
jgi:hypothetical protein